MSTQKPLIAISIGCPAGIGPEVSVVAAKKSKFARCLLIGDLRVIQRAAKIYNIEQDIKIIRSASEIQSIRPGVIAVWEQSSSLKHLPRYGSASKQDGIAQLRWVQEALHLVQQQICHALVTGPVSKDAIHSSGLKEAKDFYGHTEFLAKTLGTKEVVMAFTSKKFSTSLVTTHLPLAKVASAITPQAVASATYWLCDLVTKLKSNTPHIAIASLNPHAGENELLGKEERTIIRPGIALAQKRLRQNNCKAILFGPIGAETAFRSANEGSYDGVVAMYHDQATIPTKLVGFGEMVNVTLGLPIVRTSVDHGTGYDIAGTGKANARAMVEAIRCAVQLAARNCFSVNFFDNRP